MLITIWYIHMVIHTTYVNAVFIIFIYRQCKKDWILIWPKIKEKIRNRKR